MPDGEVGCARLGCGHGFSEHDAGGPCLRTLRARRLSDGVVVAEHRCGCDGFLWVDPGGPPVGSYRDAPAGTAAPST